MNRLSRRGFLTGLGLLALTPQVLRAQTAPGADPAFEGTLAYAVLDPATGEVLAQRAADLALPPASTLKSVTALYALDRLGPQHRFTTRVLRDGDTLVFCEVKTSQLGFAWESYGARQRKRMATLALAYISRSGWEGPVRVDLLALDREPGTPHYRLQHYQDVLSIDDNWL